MLVVFLIDSMVRLILLVVRLRCMLVCYVVRAVDWDWL